MSVERTPPLDPPIQAALVELEGMIRQRYPAADFAIAQGDDPEGFYLRATVDLDDVEDVVDQDLLDRLFELQVKQGLPVYVVPLQPIERVVQMLHARPGRSQVRLPLVEESTTTPRGQGTI